MWGGISLWLWCAFLCWLVMLNIYSKCTCWPSTCLLWQTVYSGLLPVFKSCIGLCEFLVWLNITSSLGIWFAHVFSIPYLNSVLQGNCTIKWVMRFCPPAIVFRSHLGFDWQTYFLWYLYLDGDNLKLLMRKPHGLNPKENSLRLPHYPRRGPQTYENSQRRFWFCWACAVLKGFRET